MGNTSKKLAAKCALLTKDEQKYIAATFKSASKNSEKIREEDLIVSGKLDAESLEKYWGPQIDPRLAQYLANFLFGFGPNKESAVDFNHFAELYVYNVRGTTDERLMITYTCLGKEYSQQAELPYQLLKEYCEIIASTYIKIIKTPATSCERAQKWIQLGFKGQACHIQALGEALAATVGDPDVPQNDCSSSQIGKWLEYSTLLQQLSETVFMILYGIYVRPAEDERPVPLRSILPPLLPDLEGLEAMPDYPAFIDLSHIVWINSHLPKKQQGKWRFLFSSHIHGESFSTMSGRIIDQGASVVIIQDSHGYIFGGYATAAWANGPNFTGGEESFLFTVAPKMRTYPATSFNNHYQYMNNHTKTLPNGLLMGGQFNFGGIWVAADPFGVGASADSCSSYRGYKRLSKEATFKIKNIEVWGVGPKPLSIKDSDERDTSILDKDPEARALMELAGKSRHSEGLREPE